MTGRAVFIDSSALIAFYAVHDERHTDVMRILDQLGQDDRLLVMTDYILDEVVTFLRYRYGYALALRAWEELESGRIASVEPVTTRDRLSALQLFKRYNQLKLSLTDCVSFAMMRTLNICDAVSFDDDFRRANITVLGGATGL